MEPTIFRECLFVVFDFADSVVLDSAHANPRFDEVNLKRGSVMTSNKDARRRNAWRRR